jgi:hypothetical protein
MGEYRKKLIMKWLYAAPTVRGTLVRGIRFPDQTFATDGEATDIPAAWLEQAWRLVGDTFQVLSSHQLPPTRLSWFYKWLVAEFENLEIAAAEKSEDSAQPSD